MLKKKKSEDIVSNFLETKIRDDFLCINVQEVEELRNLLDESGQQFCLVSYDEEKETIFVHLSKQMDEEERLQILTAAAAEIVPKDVSFAVRWVPAPLTEEQKKTLLEQGKKIRERMVTYHSFIGRQSVVLTIKQNDGSFRTFRTKLFGVRKKRLTFRLGDVGLQKVENQ